MIVTAFVTHKNKAWEGCCCMWATVNYEIYIRLDKIGLKNIKLYCISISI